MSRWSMLVGLLLVFFGYFLIQWARYCLEEDLFSYALLIPAVSLWLVWQQKETLRFELSAAPFISGVLLAVGAGLLGISFLLDAETATGSVLQISVRMLSLVLLVIGSAGYFLGGGFMKQVIFPAAFLVFMVPFPHEMVTGLEVGLQHASAEASGWFFGLIGASYLQDGLVFHLPNITIEVAPECSGIRSTLVLFMTSLVAGYLFLDRTWQRILFTLLVIPLGIARNAFRIVTIGWLCTEYGPEMIHSPIHHRGGPVFFALSLLPLFLMLFFFRRMNRRRAEPSNDPTATASTQAAA